MDDNQDGTVDEEIEVDDTCPRCRGTGEGVSGWGNCSMCHGRGYLIPKPDPSGCDDEDY